MIINGRGKSPGAGFESRPAPGNKGRCVRKNERRKANWRAPNGKGYGSHSLATTDRLWKGAGDRKEWRAGTCGDSKKHTPEIGKTTK